MISQDHITAIIVEVERAGGFFIFVFNEEEGIEVAELDGRDWRAPKRM